MTTEPRFHPASVIASAILVIGVLLSLAALRPMRPGSTPADPEAVGISGENAREASSPRLPGARARVLADFDQVDRAARRYRRACGRWPRHLSELLTRPEPFLTQTPIDPYSGEPYRCLPTGSGFRLICLGADGRTGGRGEASDLVLTIGGVA